MAMKQSGEVAITLSDVPLSLKFKTYNLMAFTEITGKSPLEYLERFEGLSVDNAADVAKRVCDLPFVVSFIVAGLADNPSYSNEKQAALKAKICTLIDADARRRGVSPFQVIGEVAAEILPAILGSFIVPGEQNSGNEASPQPAKPAAGKAKK